MITVPAASVPVFAERLKSTVGFAAKSLSVITTFCVVVAPSVIPADGLLIVRVAVSGPSTSVSSRIVKVAVPVVAPFKIVIVAALKL